MKTLLATFLLIIPFFLTAQNPTIYFDKTRCQRKLKMELVNELPFSISLPNHLHKIIQRRQAIKPTNYSLWKLQDKNYILINQGPTTSPTLFQTTGKYFLQIHDRINLAFIEIEISQQQFKSSIFYNCEIHD